MIEALGHSFRPYGGEEMICRRCDFVIWRVTDERGAGSAVMALNGGPCPEYAGGGLNYWETSLYALQLAEGRLAMLMDAELSGSDHPGATQYVLDKARASIRRIETGADETPKSGSTEGESGLPEGSSKP